jgi:hypothetical protein
MVKAEKMYLQALEGYKEARSPEHTLIWSEGSCTADHQGQTANWKIFDADVAANPTESGNSPWIFVRIRSIGGLINLSILHLFCPIIRVEVYEKKQGPKFSKML